MPFTSAHLCRPAPPLLSFLRTMPLPDTKRSNQNKKNHHLSQSDALRKLTVSLNIGRNSPTTNIGPTRVSDISSHTRASLILERRSPEDSQFRESEISSLHDQLLDLG